MGTPLKAGMSPFLLEVWLESHLDLIAFAVIAGGLLLRLAAATGSYLNPDEAINWLFVNQPSLGAVLSQEGLKLNPAPPFFYILLYLWQLIGSSDFLLRLPAVLAGTAALWFAYKWLGIAYNPTTGLIGVILMTFAPEVIQLSAEVRYYATVYFLTFAALYFLERALQENGANRDIPALRGVPNRLSMMVAFSALIFLAIYTDYQTIWFAIAVGIYTLIRMIRHRPGGAVTGVWIAGQATSAVLCASLYVTHISKLRGTVIEQEAREGWLRASYFHPGQDNPLLFVFDRTASVFQYFASSRIAGAIALLAFLAGLAVLLFQGLPGQAGKPRRRPLGMRLILPFVVIVIAALLRLSPFGGTRHSSYLLPFALGGVSFFLAWLTRRKLWPVLLGAIILMPLWRLTTHPNPTWYIEPKNQRRELMTAATRYVKELVPPGGLVVCDIQTEVLLRRYLSEGYRIARTNVWSYTAQDFGDNFLYLTEANGCRQGDSVCVVSAGWGENLARRLVHDYGQRLTRLREFGDNIAVFIVPVGSEILSDSLACHVAQAQHKLDSLSAHIRPLPGTSIHTVLWPSRYLVPGSRFLVPGTKNQELRTIPYSDVYRVCQQRPELFGSYLPAVALWIFGTHEFHPEFMAYMNDGESYVAGDYQFTLLGADPDTMVAAYEIRTRQASATGTASERQ